MKFELGDMVMIKVPWQHPYLGVIYKVRHSEAAYPRPLLPYVVVRLMEDMSRITGGMLTEYLGDELIMYCPSGEV